MEKIILIVGLGNPGEKFKNTPHNAGFEIIDKFASENSFPDFVLQKKSEAEMSEENLFGKDIILAKPQTFMNESGRAMKKITASHKLKNINLIIVHDDIDIPLGEIKLVKSRGSAGHKGVESIIKSLGTEDFIRLRVGIKTEQSLGSIHKTKEFVLKKFKKENQEILEKVLTKATNCLNLLIEHGLEKAMNEYNK